MTERDAASDELRFQGRWVQPAPGRIIGFVLLAMSLLGVLVGVSLVLVLQTFEALAVLVGFTVVSLLTYLALSSSTPTTVTLNGPRLVVRHGRDSDEFDLAGPIRRISTIGFPNRPNWRVQLEAVDGKIVELGPTQVDPDLIHAAITRYRAPKIPRQRTGHEDSPALSPLDRG